MEGTMETNVSSVKEASQEQINPISMESESIIEDIPILTEENYPTWKDKMEKFLKNKGLWDYVVGAKCGPENTSCNEYEGWKQKKEEIMSIFKGKCGDTTLPYIEELENITLIWSQLVTMYEFTYPSKTAGTMRRSTNYTWCVPLYEAIVDGNWKSVSEILLENKGALTARLTSVGELPIHVAVKKEKVEIVKQLIKMWPTEQFPSEQGKYETVLLIAALGGNVEMVKAIVEKDVKLVMIKSKQYNHHIPISAAALVGNKEVVNYLYPITIHYDAINHHKVVHTGERERTRATILTSLIYGEFYGQALDLLQRYPSLVLARDHITWTAMEALSKKRTAFRSSLLTKGSVRSLGYYFLYSLIDVHIGAKKFCCWSMRGDMENSFNVNGDSTQGLNGEPMSGPINNFPHRLWLSFRGPFQSALIKLVPGCKYIYDVKLKHYEASKLLKEMWRLVSEIHDHPSSTIMQDVFKAMFKATELGIVEFIEECINNCPQLLKYKPNGWKAETVFHYAIIHRPEKVFGLIHHLGPLKHLFALVMDESGNPMSHIVARRAPIERLNQVLGAALQMQRELLWYKEVESIMPSNHEIIWNRENKLPRTLFTEEHKELVKDGTTWMKDTSTQCMVVATLITTIMFAAVFTIPGANNPSSSDHTGGGEPIIYIQGKFPIIFVISNMLALCSSVASMLMFLAIITSRYAEEDFLLTLPQMLMMGLLFLFISIVGMMVTFVAAILFMFRYNLHLWISFPIIFLASIPVTIYASVEFPLFIELIFNTSSLDVFGKRN